ncbi:hypothetical protein AWC32_15665 [Mycobacterium xenopi]|nr:hypothetical protein AWC32_15665 [Mycobacterium xenopi]
MDHYSGAGYGEDRFGIGVAGGLQWRWHAVDLALLRPRLAARAEQGRSSAGVEAYSVCGMRAEYVARLGPFAYGSRWLTSRRCERCGWVVALARGTVEQEIDLYTAVSGGQTAEAVGGGDLVVLRAIFTAILADAPPGPQAMAGHRSDLLAHATVHRPVATACDQCAEGGGPAVVHGMEACPQPRVICAACTFTAGPWAGEREDTPSGECIVAAPCSVLTALAAHYGIAVDTAARPDARGAPDGRAAR